MLFFDKSFNDLMISTPGAPTLKTRSGSSPNCSTLDLCSCVEVKWRWDILVIECLKDSSKAPSLTSPPCIWATGMFLTKEVATELNISYLSPRTSNKSGFRALKHTGSFLNTF